MPLLFIAERPCAKENWDPMPPKKNFYDVNVRPNAYCPYGRGKNLSGVGKGTSDVYLAFVLAKNKFN